MSNPIDITPQEHHEKIVSLKDLVKASFIELGKYLYWFKKLARYKFKDFDTFDKYVECTDVDIGRSTAYTLIQIYKKFVLDLKIQPDRLLEARHTKLAIICSHATEENVYELISKADTLSKTDLKKEIRREFGEPVSERDEFHKGLRIVRSIILDVGSLGEQWQQKILDKILVLLDEVMR